MIKNQYTILIARLSKLYRIIRAFVLQLHLSINLLDRGLEINRGLNYSKNWQHYTNRLISSYPHKKISWHWNGRKEKIHWILKIFNPLF